MTCPVGWPTAAAYVLWEVYGNAIKKFILFVLAAANLVLWKLI